MAELYPDRCIEDPFCGDGIDHRSALYHRIQHKSIGISDDKAYIGTDCFNFHAYNLRGRLPLSGTEDPDRNKKKKIFLQFLEDLKIKTPGPVKAVPVEEIQKPDSPRKLHPGEITPAPAEPKKRRKPKNTIDINRILQSTSSAGTKTPKKILEDDMEKILRKNREGLPFSGFSTLEILPPSFRHFPLTLPPG